MFLNEKELIRLTSYKYAAKQLEWLRRHGYKHDTGADGKPKVLKKYVENLLGLSSNLRKSQSPNFASINK